jgi:hypothetical protein
MDSPPDRIFIGPVLPRESTVDQGYASSIPVVVLGERASPNQRNSHRAKVAWAGCAELDFFPLRQGLTVLNRDGRGRTTTLDRKPVDRTHRFYSGQDRNPFEHLVVHLRLAKHYPLPGKRYSDGHGEDVGRSISQIHSLKFHITPDEQTRSRQEYQSESGLDHDE